MRRLILAVPLLFIVSALSFLLISATPGDAAYAMLGISAPNSSYVALRHELGLDQPVYEQYSRWVARAAHGDLGVSLFTSEPVTRAINARLPVTLLLITGSLGVTLVIGAGLGLLSSVRGGAISRLVDGFALLGYALPPFWVGAMLIALFAVRLRWFQPTGYVTPDVSLLGWAMSLVLPVCTLAIHTVAAVAKQTREAMRDVLGSEYIRMAWASGISPLSIYLRHAFKNVAARVLTVLGLQFIGLLSGAVIVESVFGLPGAGSLLVNASLEHDLPVIQGIVIYFTLLIVMVNLLIDLTYSWLNPQVRVH